jgi:predicted pyridoxine 5'-phosphate oxidase superfamily flavin-nucleotide-binding protein
MNDTYHAGMRGLQDRFDTRRLADRLDEQLGRAVFTEQDQAFIESRTLFFLATADARGHPDCSYKGGIPGFVRVTGPGELEFPSYDGNGQFRSLGNIGANPAVGLLFIDFESPKRLRVNGDATLLDDPQSLARHHGAQLVVRVRARRIFPNCPRYIHRSAGAELSADAPRPGHTPPAAAWKSMPIVADVLPQGRPDATR